MPGLQEENNNHGTIINPGVTNPTAFSWTGKWESDFEYYGTFDFIQSGNAVTGTCTAGSFSGTVFGNTVIGICERRKLRLTMSPDGEKFSMEYDLLDEDKFDSSENWSDLNTIAVRVR